MMEKNINKMSDEAEKHKEVEAELMKKLEDSERLMAF